MRITAAKLLVALAGAIGVLFVPASVQAAGITLSPATLRLELAEGKAEQQASFAITNHYEVPVTLNFAVERPLAANANQPHTTNPATFTLVDTPQLTLAPGQQLAQTIRLRNNASLAPG